MKLKTRFAAGALVLASLCFSTARAQGQAPTLEMVKVNDDVYVFTTGLVGGGNATALVTDDGVLLVDSKGGNVFDRMMELLRTVTDQPVKYVVSTHYDPDHTGANSRFQDAGAVVIAHEVTRLRMDELEMAGRPVITIDESARLRLGGKVIEVIHPGRGHTGGDLVVHLPDYRLLIAGDLFVASGYAPLDYQTGGSIREWPRTLDRLLLLDVDVVVPGHGERATSDKAAMRRYRDGLVTMRERVQEMIRAKSTRDDFEKVLRSEFGWQNFHVARGLDGIIAELQYR